MRIYKAEPKPKTPELTYSFRNGFGIRSLTDARGIVHTSAVKSSVKKQPCAYTVDDYDMDWLRSPILPKSVNSTRKLTVGDVFCGAGIFSLGVEEACRAFNIHCEHIFGIDFNKEAMEVYKANFPEANHLLCDVLELIDGEFNQKPSKSEKLFLSRNKHVDILIGGPPCQGHSDLNNRTRRDDPKNRLYSKMSRIAQLLAPEFVLIENVPGVIHDRNAIVQRTASELSDLGYTISSGVVNLWEIGLPQKRKRFVLLATKKGSCEIPDILQVERCGRRPLRWAIGDLISKYGFQDSTFDTSSTHSAENQRRIAYLFANRLYNLPNSQRPPCHRNKVHSYTAVYGRMNWNELSPTITGGFGSTGQGRFVHPLRQRSLTPHEAARVQFVPDFFHFPDVGRRAVQQIIGNAAPPKLSYAIILNSLIKGVFQ